MSLCAWEEIVMITRVAHMEALRLSWESARPGYQKVAALKTYEAAQKSNVDKMEKTATRFLAKLIK
jgi:hypothetical protein